MHEGWAEKGGSKLQDFMKDAYRRIIGAEGKHTLLNSTKYAYRKTLHALVRSNRRARCVCTNVGQEGEGGKIRNAAEYATTAGPRARHPGIRLYCRTVQGGLHGGEHTPRNKPSAGPFVHLFLAENPGCKPPCNTPLQQETTEYASTAGPRARPLTPCKTPLPQDRAGWRARGRAHSTE